MNLCVACGEPCPEGYQLCWACRHKAYLPEDECESCRIDFGDRKNSGLLEDEQ